MKSHKAKACRTQEATKRTRRHEKAQGGKKQEETVGDPFETPGGANLLIHVG